MPAKTPPPASLSTKGVSKKSRNKTPPPQTSDKLITSDAVFKKLRWHPSVDTEDIEVGYIDRFSGLRWMKMSKWREGGSLDFDSIPWHRVMQFACKGIVFWDRENRTERLADLFNGTLAASAAPAVVTTNDDNKDKGKKGAKKRSYPRTDRADLREYDQTSSTWKRLAPSSSTEDSGIPSRPIRIVTQNVLFARFDADTLHYTQRYPFLFESLHNESTKNGPIDVICFQETDSKFCQFLTQHPWIQANYRLTEFDFGREGVDTIVCFLNTSPVCQCISVSVHQFTPHVHAICCEVVAGKQTVYLANLHLTSDKANDAQRKRAIQLEGLFKMSARYPDSILLGDFNFGEGGENDAIDWGKYKDRSTDSGATFDPDTNNLAAWNSRTFKSRRMDRIMIRSASITTSCCRVINTNHRSTDSIGYRKHLKAQVTADCDDIPTVVLRGIPSSGKTTLAAVVSKWMSQFSGVTPVVVTREASSSTSDWIGCLIKTSKPNDDTTQPIRIIDSPNILYSDVKAIQQICNISNGNMFVVTMDTSTVQCHQKYHSVTSNSGGGDGGSPNPTHEVFLATKNILNSQTPAISDIFTSHDLDGDYAPLEEQLAGFIKVDTTTTKHSLQSIAEGWTIVPKPACEPVPVFSPSDHFGVVVNIDITAADEEDDDDEEEDEIEPIPRITTTFDRNVALAVVLPQPLAARLAPLRQKYDKAFTTWPAHLNLVWPFVPMSCYLGNKSAITDAIKHCNITPFRMTLSKLTSFNDHTRNRSSLYLAPEYSGDMDVMRVLRQELDNRFIDTSKKPFHGYNPHCTVGRSTPSEVDKIAKSYKWTGQPGDNSISFWVTELCVLTRVTEDGPMKVVDQVDIPSGEGDQCPYYHSSNIWNSPDEIIPPLEVPKPILEPHPLGGRKTLSVYTPNDQLERFMLHFTRRLSQVEGAKSVSLCQDSPTHISQLGGKYYLPETFINEYLRYWKRSIEDQDTNDIPFFMEEIRGTTFRLYIDVDIKLTSDRYLDIHTTNWMQIILSVVSKVYSRSKVNCVVMSCHGEFSSVPHPEISHKSGYRIYFLDLYTGYKDYKRFMDTLHEDFIAKTSESEQQDNIFDIKDVIDTQSTGWERGRLIGTQKRRKNLVRIYKFDSAWSQREGEKAAKNDGMTSFLSQPKNVEQLLYSTTLRMWGVLPRFASLPHSLVPDLFENYHHLIICTGDSPPVSLDLLTLQTTPITSDHPPAHLTTMNTAITGFDNPPPLSRFTMIPYADIFICLTGTTIHDDSSFATQSPLEFISAQLASHRAASPAKQVEQDVNLARVNKVIVAATICS